MDARVPQKGDAPANSQTKESYETVGMHRLIGGFYYNFFLYIFAMIFFILMFTVILPLFMPYPEIEGYSRIVYGLLGFAFGFFDFGSTRGTTSPENSAQLADGLLRFLGEHATTNPGRAFKYVQFFAWFQMFTGMIQITIISLIVLVWFPITNMAHLTWFVLGYLLIQFPGCTQIFDSIFKGFQRFNAYSIYTFLKDTVIRYAMMIAGVTLGRYWGAKNPQIGEIVGATIGYILSLYGIEICTFILGCIFYRIMLGGDAGWRVIDIFIPTFDREIAKQVLTFSGKLWVGTLLSQFWMLLENVLILTLISQYGVWMGLISFANQISSIVTMQGVMVRNSTATLAEAYMNDKQDLFKYYVLNLIRYNSFITIGLLIPFAVLFPPVLDSLIGLIPDLSNYE
ncbi:hypothetical protein GF325_18870, partial [Candidatus Bathyarchaeota archaeon]|nr:hypothetical protein [Candidatus Bathyarchaeota archaeon]